MAGCNRKPKAIFSIIPICDPIFLVVLYPFYYHTDVRGICKAVILVV